MNRDTEKPVATDHHLIEHTVSSESILQGHFLQVRRDQVRLPDGGVAVREYVLHPGAVMIVAMGGDGKLVLERQYRHPLGQVMIEFPAGKIDPGETSLACAMRELQEETGWLADEWAFATRLHPVIAYSNEFIDLWFARELRAGRQQLDRGEFLEVFQASTAELLQWCASGEVSDAKTLVAALWLQNLACGAWTLNWQSEGPL